MSSYPSPAAYTPTPPAPPPKAPAQSQPLDNGSRSPQAASPPMPPIGTQGYTQTTRGPSSPQGSSMGQSLRSPLRSSSHTLGVAGGTTHEGDQHNHPGSSQHAPHAAYNRVPRQQQQQQQQQSRLPPIEENWLPPGISALPTRSLVELVQTPSLLDSLLHAPHTTHPALQASTSQLQAQLSANEALAQTLAQLAGRVVAARSETGARLVRTRALEGRWRKRQGEVEERLGPWGARGLHARLVREIAEGEGLCRGVEESFVEEDGVGTSAGAGAGGKRSEREVAEWVRRVREGRRTLHLRRERRRRWDEGRVGGWR